MIVELLLSAGTSLISSLHTRLVAMIMSEVGIK